jgi:hypothetical protein
VPIDNHDQILIDAIFSLLAQDNQLVTFDGFVPTYDALGNKINPPYVVVYTTVNYPSGDRDNSLDGRSRMLMGRWYCHCVGGSPMAARGLAQRVRTQLLDVHPILPDGMSCGLIREVPGPPAPHRDETTGVLLIDAIVIYELMASV